MIKISTYVKNANINVVKNAIISIIILLILFSSRGAIMEKEIFTNQLEKKLKERK